MAHRADPALMRAISEAIDQLRAEGWAPQDLAERLDVAPSTISRWRSEGRQPALDLLPRIDHLLGRPRGEVLRRAGYVEETADVQTAIAADPRLSTKSKSALSLLYDVLVTQDAAGVSSQPAAAQATG